MLIPTLVIPGPWLDGDQAEAEQVRSLLRELESHLADGAIALRWFLDVKRPTYEEREAARLRHEAEINSLQVQFALERGIAWGDPAYFQDARNAAQIAHLESITDFEYFPESMKNRQRSIHSRTFLFALDGVWRTLSRLKNISISRDAADHALNILNIAAPDLRKVRNSAAHSDARAVGKGKKERPIPQKISDDEELLKKHHIISEDSTIIFTNSNLGSDYVFVVEDGSNGSISVTNETLWAARNAIQLLLDNLPWKVRLPRAVPQI